ncbi:MAG: hypothetical protein WCL34_00205, partial [Methylococcaceae bacterium]
ADILFDSNGDAIAYLHFFHSVFLYTARAVFIMRIAGCNGSSFVYPLRRTILWRRGSIFKKETRLKYFIIRV